MNVVYEPRGRGGRGSTQSWRAISIVDAHMDAVIAMPLLVCGQPGKNGTQLPSRALIF